MGYMYEWLNGLFGTNLSDFLWGYDCTTSDYTGGQYYIGIGLVTIIIALISVSLFYFFIDSPRWSHRWLPWMFWMLVTSVISGFVGAGWTVSLYNQGVFGECLEVHHGNCWMFGLANFIVSAVLLLLLSFIFKRFSRMNTHTPWMSKFLVWKIKK